MQNPQTPDALLQQKQSLEAVRESIERKLVGGSQAVTSDDLLGVNSKISATYDALAAVQISDACKNSNTWNAAIFWNEQADKLKGDLSSCDAEFVRSASLENISAQAGNWFIALSENTRSSIVATMRDDHLK